MPGRRGGSIDSAGAQNAREGTPASGVVGLAVPGLEAGIFALILIVILVLEPHGIHGRLLKWKVWFELFPFYRRDMLRRRKRYLKTERLR